MEARCDGQTDGRVSRVLAIVSIGRGPGVYNCTMLYVIFLCLTQGVYTRQIVLGFEPKADKIKSYKIHSEKREG